MMRSPTPSRAWKRAWRPGASIPSSLVMTILGGTPGLLTCGRQAGRQAVRRRIGPTGEWPWRGRNRAATKEPAQGENGVGNVQIAIVIGIRSIETKGRQVPEEEKRQGKNGIAQVHLAAPISISTQEVPRASAVLAAGNEGRPVTIGVEELEDHLIVRRDVAYSRPRPTSIHRESEVEQGVAGMTDIYVDELGRR